MSEDNLEARPQILQSALDYMEEAKFNSDLRPETVAEQLNISRRQLFLLFEENDLSFARTLSAMRVRAARKLLIAKPQASVIQIAFTCGFDSLATFYRVFTSTYGAPPRKVRRNLLAERNNIPLHSVRRLQPV